MAIEGKNWFGTMVEALTSAFDKFVQVFRKNGLIYTLVILILFVLLWSLVIYPIRLDTLVEKQIERQFNKEKQEQLMEKTSSENKRYEANEVVTPLLENLVDHFGLERAILLEQHNNSTNISGIDFLYFSSYYEAINVNDYDIDYIGDYLQRQPIATMFGNEIITMLKHKDYLYYSNLSDYKRNKRLLIKLNKLGVENTMLIPIRNAKHIPVLIICVCDNKPINTEEVYQYIQPYLNQIENLLL